MNRDQAVVVHTPEHVAIHLVAAGFGRRFTAFIIDLLLAGAAIGVLGSLAALLPEALATLVSTTGGFLIMWGYHVYFEVRHAGQSPGKRMLSLRVVDVRGLPIDVRQALIRNVVRALDMIPLGGIGMAVCLLDRQRRRLGDLIAGTLVVEERQPPAPDLAVLQAWRQNSLDTPRLRRQLAHRLGLEEREFMLALVMRREALEERARYELFERVGDLYRRRLGIDQDRLSGENLVRGLVALSFISKGG